MFISINILWCKCAKLGAVLWAISYLNKLSLDMLLLKSLKYIQYKIKALYLRDTDSTRSEGEM